MQRTSFGRRNIPQARKRGAPTGRTSTAIHQRDELALDVPGYASRWLSGAKGLASPIAGLVLVAGALAGLRLLAAEPVPTVIDPTQQIAGAPALPACSASLEQFKTLRDGISVAEANAIMGCPGTASRVRLAFAAACPQADLFRTIAIALRPAEP